MNYREHVAMIVDCVLISSVVVNTLCRAHYAVNHYLDGHRHTKDLVISHTLK